MKHYMDVLPVLAAHNQLVLGNVRCPRPIAERYVLVLKKDKVFKHFLIKVGGQIMTDRKSVV